MAKRAIKEKPARALKSMANLVGVSFKKALRVAIPPEILEASSFFGGLNRLGDAMENLGRESKENQERGRQYVIRHTGGAVADVAVGVVLLGVPVTLVTSLFSDGCKVISQVLKGASTEDEEVTQMGEFFDNVSSVSNNLMRLFDVPSKEVANEARKSVKTMIEALKKRNRLSDSLLNDLRELEGMCKVEVEDAEKWAKSVQEKLERLAKDGLSEFKIDIRLDNIKHFIEHPSVEHIHDMRDGMIADFKAKDVKLKNSSVEFADRMIESLERISTKDFKEKMRSILVKNYELADRTQKTAENAIYYMYRFTHSLLNTTYKGAALFGKHYKRQLEEAVRR